VDGRHNSVPSKVGLRVLAVNVRFDDVPHGVQTRIDLVSAVCFGIDIEVTDDFSVLVVVFASDTDFDIPSVSGIKSNMDHHTDKLIAHKLVSKRERTETTELRDIVIKAVTSSFFKQAFSEPVAGVQNVSV
jgi:hypothetical protein